MFMYIKTVTMPYSKQLAVICKTIRQTRVSLGYSQQYVAGKLYISQNAYSKIEAGITKLTVDTLFTLAHILGINIIELISPAVYPMTYDQKVG